MCNDNDPRLSWREANPELAASSAALISESRAAREADAKREARRVKRASSEARHRQSIGEDWDGKPDNDNIGWPLAKALRADGKEHLLRAAMEYRRIEASATSGALLGGTSIGMDPVQIDQKTWIRPDGSIAYKGERQLTAAKFVGDIPSTQAVRTNDTSTMKMKPVQKPWTGDVKVNAMVDDQRRLARLRQRLGALTDAFEAAVVHGQTLEDLGRGAGIGGKNAAMGGGRALVMTGLYAVADELQRIRMDEMAPSLRAA